MICPYKALLLYVLFLSPTGVDPKSVLCVFFKQGLCKKSEEKCKFSHNLAIERKGAKRSAYDEELANGKVFLITV